MIYHIICRMNNKKKNWPKKLGMISLAVLWCLAERGAFILETMTSASMRKGLYRSIKEVGDLKTIGEYYEILKSVDKNTARTIIWRLKQKGLVEQNGRGAKFNLTNSGKEFLNFLSNKNQKKNWDGKWRIIMFDVPENKKGQRDLLRAKLLREDYLPLQKSVLIGKYPLSQDTVEELINRDIYKYLRMIVVGEIDDESILENFS